MAAETQVGGGLPAEKILDALQKRMQRFCWPGSPILATTGKVAVLRANSAIALFSD